MTQMNMDRPDAVKNAIKLLYCSMGISIIYIGVEQSVLPDDEPVLFGVLFASIYIMFFFIIYMIGKGRNWARLASLILFIVGTISHALLVEEYTIYLVELVLEYPFGVASFILLLNIVGYALHTVALVFLFQKPSSDWFRQMKEQRQAHKMSV